jgi:hypothetical protein
MIRKMPTENELQSNINELLEDIYFVNHLNKAEIKQTNQQIRLRITKANLPYNVADIMSH